MTIVFSVIVIRVLVSPGPVSFLILLAQFGKILVPAMVFFHPCTVGSILLRIPDVVVIMVCVVVLVLVGPQWCRTGSKRNHDRGCE